MKYSWTWQRATGSDIPDIVHMAVHHFQSEVEVAFVPDSIAFGRNATLAVVNQFYLPNTEMIWVARCTATNRLLGYVWAHRNFAPWSDEPMCAVRMVHVDLNLAARDRVRMIQEMIMIWETWCIDSNINVICSTTMRGDQTGFMRIHERFGYTVRGSYAYKRLTKEQQCQS